MARQKAIVLGRFTDLQLVAHEMLRLPSVVAWLRANVKVPEYTGLPYGHVKVKATQPVGRKVGMRHRTRPGRTGYRRASSLITASTDAGRGGVAPM